MTTRRAKEIIDLQSAYGSTHSSKEAGREKHEKPAFAQKGLAYLQFQQCRSPPATTYDAPHLAEREVTLRIRRHTQ